MNKIIFITSILLLVCLSSISNAQISFEIGPNIGIISPTGSYAGNVNDFYLGNKYGLGTGFNVGATAKLDLFLLSGRVDLNYSWLSNSGSLTSSNGTVNTKQNIFSLGAGPEYKLNIPMSPIKPYACFELLFSTISGETTFQGAAQVSSNTLKIASATRTGISLIVGSEISFKTWTLDLNVRYNLHNLAGKKFDTYHNNDRTNSYSALNDGGDPDFDGNNHPVGSSRNITTVQLNVGVLFGL